MEEITKADKQEMQVASIDPDAPLMVQIMQLTERGIKLDVEYVKGLLAVKKEIEADEARLAYASAFAAAQADIGGVVKTRRNKQTDSMYAGLDDVIEMSKTVCAKHDFSITFSEGVTETADHIRLCATVLHKDGHEKIYHYDVPLGGVGIKGVVNMTAIHAKATSVSYGQRYLLCMIWNIPTKDNDGNTEGDRIKPNPKPITEVDEIQLDKLLKMIPEKPGYELNRGRIRAIFAEHGRPPNDKDMPKGLSWLLATFGFVDIYSPLPINGDGSVVEGKFESEDQPGYSGEESTD